MGIQNSNLDETKIKEILIKNYEITAKKIIEINRGTANIYKIVARDKNYILKEFNEKKDIESIQKEIDIINFLKEQDIKVPKYIKTNKDKYYIVNKNRIIILQKYVDGYTMENNTVGDYKKIIGSATILGKLTSVLKKYSKLDDEGFIAKNFSRNTLENGIQKMKNLITRLKDDNIYKDKIQEDLNKKIKVAEELYKKFNFEVIQQMTIINSHGDYSIQQLIYNDKGETTVIDFETAKTLPIAWEVIRSYSYIDKEAQNGNLNIDTLVEYFKEFSKYIQLNEYDLKYASYIYLIQLVGSTFGYKEYNDDFTQSKLLEFAFFRTNLCKFLYENAEKISIELMRKIKIK